MSIGVTVLVIFIVLIVLLLCYFALNWFIDTPWGKGVEKKGHLQMYDMPEKHGKIENQILLQHQPPALCEQKLTLAPTCQPQAINERPLYTDFQPGCPLNLKATDPELATRGTGVGEPAFPDQDSFPAPFEKTCHKCKPAPPNPSVPEPSDAYDEDYELIDYEIRIPKSTGLVCARPSGVGEPSCDKTESKPASL
jgi:hypothetical protein